MDFPRCIFLFSVTVDYYFFLSRICFLWLALWDFTGSSCGILRTQSQRLRSARWLYHLEMTKGLRDVRLERSSILPLQHMKRLKLEA
ncbi:hypothetical protein EDB86DRAFT_2869750 [Lactarius hatsudake]|nr:hypothetical protein EDB86DRAFT_2869750 [Lactarius hatsudake]